MMNLVSTIYRKILINSGKKWQSRFSKRNTIPSQVGGYTDPHDIADCFKESFSKCCFDSYKDNN